MLHDLAFHSIDPRAVYPGDAHPEAVGGGPRPAIDRLLLELRQLNEGRRSIDRRRDQTRYLTRQLAGRA